MINNSFSITSNDKFENITWSYKLRSPGLRHRVVTW